MKLLVVVTILYSLLPPLVYWFIRKKLNNEVQPILPFLVLCLIAVVYEFIFTALLRINTVSWFYTYDFLSIFTIQYFFYHVLEKKVKKVVLVSTVLYIALFFYALTHNEMKNYLTYLSYLNSFITFLIIFYSVLWFKKVFMETRLLSLSQSPTFYFISGFLFYYLGVVVLFLLANSIYLTNNSNFQYYWLINLFFTIFHKTFLIIGIWKARKN